jgi:hypothetical protein
VTQPALFDLQPTTTPVRRPDASDPVLLVLAEVAYLIDHGHDNNIGAPAVGHNRRTVATAAARGWLTRTTVGDSDTEGGPHRLTLTPAGRHQLDLEEAYARAHFYIGIQHHVAARFLTGGCCDSHQDRP